MKGQSVARTRLRLNPSRVKIPLGKEGFQCMKFSHTRHHPIAKEKMEACSPLTTGGAARASVEL